MKITTVAIPISVRTFLCDLADARDLSNCSGNRNFST